jgi:LuxR family transcriptional regulator, maltose regulon positive regulatory protein
VSREKLIGVLETSLATPVIFVSAGQGWGRTTLLTQWASRSQRPFAWVSVDERDNDPIVLLTYVAVAVDRVSPLDPTVFDALASAGVSVEATVVPRLGAALATVREPVVLVLDDVHLLDNPACLDAVASLTRHVSEGSQMALSARRGPALSLGALRARGVTLEIGPDDLRMDEAEARELLSAAGAGLPDDQVAELTEQTEGWSAGLYLAALSIRAGGVTGERAATFSGSDRVVSDYLRPELLAHVSEDELRFLTRTAVLERMTGPLCDAVLETSGSAAALESLARSNLFLVPLDPTGESYRYHHLFQQLLRSELARAEPDLVPILRVRATDWCEAHGYPETAIAYAQEAGDVDRVARLVEYCAHPAYESGRVTTVQSWLGWVDAHGALDRHPAVAALGALAAAVHGRPAEADRLADAAERGRSHRVGPLPDGSPSIDAWLALLRAVRCRRGLARMRADADLAVRTLARSSSFWPSATLCLAIAQWLAGEVDQADDLLGDVAEEGVELGGPEAAAAALGARAAIAIERGAWVQAEELVNRAVRVVDRSRLGEYPSSALVYAVAARVALHRGEDTRAQQHLAQAQRLRSQLTCALPWWAVETRLELARAYLTTADAGGARTMLREVAARRPCDEAHRDRCARRRRTRPARAWSPPRRARLRLSSRGRCRRAPWGRPAARRRRTGLPA